ncbi:MAG: leukocidin family pore-forming toxin [Polyangia bacterium]
MKIRHRLLGMEAALLIGLLLAPDAGAQSAKKKIIVLGRGEKSAVITGVAKPRQRLNHKEMVSAAKQRKEKLKSAKEERAETKKRIKAQLADVDAVAADLSETADDDEDDGLVVESAIEAGVPVVLENVSSAKMAKLAGVGVSAGTAVIETTEGGGQYNITILDGPELKVKSGPAKAVQGSAKQVAENKAQKKALEDYDAKQKAAKAKESKQSNGPVAAKLTGEQKAAHVEKIISEKAFKKGVRRHALLTGKCDGRDCKEYQLTLQDPLAFCPQSPSSGICSPPNSLDPMIEWGVYKTTGYDPTTGQSIPTAYIVTRAAGRANLAMVSDEMQNRGFYLDSWNIKFDASYAQNMRWRLDKASPENANQQAQVAYTTGFTVGLSGAIAGSTSSSFGGLNASYSSSSTTTMNTEEFGITRSTTPTSVEWLNKMQMNAQPGNYNNPEDLFIAWFMSTVDIALLPRIAKNGTEFHAEATWTGNRDPSCGACTVVVNGTFKLQMYRAWVNSIQMFPQGTRFERMVEPFTVEAKIPLTLVTNW